MSFSILQVRPGQSAQIESVAGSGSLRQRLLDMGLLPKQRIRVERVAPGGSPLWIEVLGVHLALRKQEAELIQMDKTSIEEARSAHPGSMPKNTEKSGQ